MLRKMKPLNISIMMVASLFLMVALAFMNSAPIQAGSGWQEWYLFNVSSPVSGKIMARTNNAVNSDITISPGQNQMWLADVAAVIDVTFPDGYWIIQIKTEGSWGDNSTDCRLAVGEWNVVSSSFRDFSTATDPGSFTYSYDQFTHIVRIEGQVGSEKIAKNNYLALNIRNQDTISHKVFTDGESSMKSPDSDPGYPTPEIHPDSVASISSLKSIVTPGFGTSLVVMDTNTGDVPITIPSMDLISIPGSLHMKLTKYSPSFSGGDTNDNGIFDPGETWTWIPNVTPMVDTTYVATGHGNDPYGNDVTAPDHPTEQVNISIDVFPNVPASTNTGIGLLVGGIALSMLFAVSRKNRKLRNQNTKTG